MQPLKKLYSVFISYSHEDVKYVLPIIELLSINRKDLGFFDLKPGAIWKQEIENAIGECEVFLVFWCKHSSESVEVQKEYSIAIEKKKTIIPVLLDKTKLSKELSEYQWIDFSSLGVHEDISEISKPDEPNLHGYFVSKILNRLKEDIPASLG